MQDLQLYLKRDCGTDVFLWVLWNFQEQSFYRTPTNDCFCPKGLWRPQLTIFCDVKSKKNNKFDLKFELLPSYTVTGFFLKKIVNDVPLQLPKIFWPFLKLPYCKTLAMVIGKQMDGDGGDRLKNRVECRFFEEKRVVS